MPPHFERGYFRCQGSCKKPMLLLTFPQSWSKITSPSISVPMCRGEVGWEERGGEGRGGEEVGGM